MLSFLFLGVGCGCAASCRAVSKLAPAASTAHRCRGALDISNKCRKGARVDIVARRSCQFVSEVLPGKHGWVLRSIDGANHMLAESHGGKQHALVQSRSTVMESGRLRKGTARLRQAEYFKTGMRMKLAGNTCAMIHETLRVVAEEEGREALWNLADIKEVFGLDAKKRVVAEDKGGGLEDKHQRCVHQCRDICAKIKDEAEDCDLFLHNLSKFEKQLTARRRKRKAAVALSCSSMQPDGAADDDKGALQLSAFHPPVAPSHHLLPPPPVSDPPGDHPRSVSERHKVPELLLFHHVPQPS